MLPGALKEIAEVAGEPAAVSIAAAVGGRRVYIPLPKKLNAKHWLVACVGLRAAEKIAAHFATERSGQRIDIPLYSGGVYPQLRRTVAKRIHDLHTDGKSVSQIQQDVGVTERTVHRHRRAHRKDNENQKQGKLF